MTNPVVISVLIPTCNNDKTIERCLEAVRGSTYQNYELIIIDCGSKDRTVAIVNNYADDIVKLETGFTRSQARTAGRKIANGEIIVNIDSDVVISKDTLEKIDKYFREHKEVDAITGMLSKEHPNPDFFSQYKNLYMHYIFKKLPERITFLYGSIYAYRSSLSTQHFHDKKTADDTAFGQKIFSEGYAIAVVKDLEVVHLKKYSIFSFIKNDFRIPFDWADIFLRHKGYKQLFKFGTGFAHSPKEQIISVLLAAMIFFLFLIVFYAQIVLIPVCLLILSWFFLNRCFFKFLFKEKNIFLLLLLS